MLVGGVSYARGSGSCVETGELEFHVRRVGPSMYVPTGDLDARCVVGDVVSTGAAHQTNLSLIRFLGPCFIATPWNSLDRPSLQQSQRTGS